MTPAENQMTPLEKITYAIELQEEIKTCIAKALRRSNELEAIIRDLGHTCGDRFICGGVPYHLNLVSLIDGPLRQNFVTLDTSIRIIE